MRITKTEYKRIKSGKKPVALEFDDCVEFVNFLERSGIKEYSHIPMETRTPYDSVKQKNKKMGVKGGVPDYLITLPISYTGREKRKLIFIEMKRRTGGVVSEKQKKWIEILNECEGVDCYVAKGLKKATEIVESYYKNKLAFS